MTNPAGHALREPAGCELVWLTPEDWPAHRELRLRALLSAPEAFGATYAGNAAYDEATWRQRLTELAYLQARVDGVPVGMAGLAPEPDGPAAPAMLISMFVDPQFRGRGVGRAIVEAVVALGVERGLDRVTLMVRVANDAARSLYDACGFVATGHLEDDEPDPAGTRRELQMAIDLTSRRNLAHGRVSS